MSVVDDVDNVHSFVVVDDGPVEIGMGYGEFLDHVPRREFHLVISGDCGVSRNANAGKSTLLIGALMIGWLVSEGGRRMKVSEYSHL